MVPKLVVLDTLTLLFAIFGRRTEGRIYRMCRSGQLRLGSSAALLRELERALRYPRFGLLDDQIDRSVRDVSCHASIFRPRERIDRIRDDPDDNRVLECAVAAGANLVVSADPHLLEVVVFRDILILSAEPSYSLLLECV